MNRPKDKCPSCFQPIAPTDFLCPNCELILDASQAPEGRTTEVSVVRRMLERPQRGVPSAKLDVKAEVRAATKAKNDGLEGPTRRLDLGPELAGVPVVVATLSKKSESLTELEAWLVSLIDGLSNAEALAKKAGVRELELRVMLRTLNEKRIIDFADEPLSDEDLDLPAVMGTLDDDEPPVVAATLAAPAAPAAPSYGANVDRRDGRFVAPSSSAKPAPPPQRSSSADDWSNVMPSDPAPPPPPIRAATNTPSHGAARAAPRVPNRATGAPSFPGDAPPMPVAPPPPPPASPPRPTRPPMPRIAPSIPPELEQDAPVVTGKAEPPTLTPSTQPAKAVTRHDLSNQKELQRRPSETAAAPPRGQPTPLGDDAPVQRTDPRIAYTGKANRKVLDALKQVRRNDGTAGPASAPTRDEEKQPLADVLARDSLQVALRMEQSGRMDEAIRFLEKSIGQSPDAASLYNRLGIILMRERGDYRRAEQMIRKATELAPDNKVYATNHQQVLQRHAMKSHR
ncbi:MAG: hypothetical protein QM817_35460 [Archangium sp.]